MKRRSRLALVLAVTLVVAACGSDDGTDTDAGGQPDQAGSTETTADTTAEEPTGNQTSAEPADDSGDDETEGTADSGDSDDTDGGQQAVAPTILGLEILSIDFDTGEVAIANNGDSEITLDGYWMCIFPQYGEIEGVGAVAPGETVSVVAPVSLSAAGGELGLYTSDSFSSSEAIQAYVEWGSDGHERASVAIEAGIWDGKALTVDGSTLTVGG